MGRVIHVTLDKEKREQALIEQRITRTMFFRIVLSVTIVVGIAVAISFGPVLLIAEATRISQASSALAVELDEEFTVNQSLIIDVAVAKSNDRLTKIAKRELGMVERGQATTLVSLDAEEETHQLALREPETAWERFVRLTMGEASALLVGDVGLSALR